MARCWGAGGHSFNAFCGQLKNPGRHLAPGLDLLIGLPPKGLSIAVSNAILGSGGEAFPVSGERLERGALGAVLQAPSLNFFARAPRSLKLLYLQSRELVYHPFPTLTDHCHPLCPNTEEE